MRQLLGFLVSADGSLVAATTSFAQAKQAAEPYTEKAVHLTIRSHSGADWRRTWLYDRTSKQWVEQKLTLPDEVPRPEVDSR